MRLIARSIKYSMTYDRDLSQFEGCIDGLEVETHKAMREMSVAERC